MEGAIWPEMRMIRWMCSVRSNRLRQQQQQQQQSFYSPLSGVPEETFTLPPSWSSSNLYQLLPSITIHSILPVQIACVAIFLHHLCPRPLWSITPPHIPYISLPNKCLLSAIHAHTVTTCFAVVSRVYHVFMVAVWNWEDNYIFILSFVRLLSSFSSPNRSHRRVDVCHNNNNNNNNVHICMVQNKNPQMR